MQYVAGLMYKIVMKPAMHATLMKQTHVFGIALVAICSGRVKGTPSTKNITIIAQLFENKFWVGNILIKMFVVLGGGGGGIFKSLRNVCTEIVIV